MIQRSATTLLRLLGLVDRGQLDAEGDPLPIANAVVTADIWNAGRTTKLTATPIALAAGNGNGYETNDYTGDLIEPTDVNLAAYDQVMIVYTATAGSRKQHFTEIAPVRA